jgi:hypothetical protein
MSRSRTAPNRVLTMPSLFRFLVLLGIAAGIIYAGMFALAQFYNPTLREITVSIPPDRLKQK